MTNIVQLSQAPLRDLYKATPAAAMVTDHACTGGTEPSDPFHLQVEPMDGCGVVIPVSVHQALGGPQDAPTPGDLLCAALAACQDSAIRMVANRLGVQVLALQVRVTATVDVRGALGMEADVPVGFQSMACEVALQVPQDTPARTLATLHKLAQRSCVVGETLRQPPPIQVRFS